MTEPPEKPTLARPSSFPRSFALRLREIRELGLRRTLFRVIWELRQKVGLFPSAARLRRRIGGDAASLSTLDRKGIPFGPPPPASWLRDRLGPDGTTRLEAEARNAISGRILCFRRSTVDFGRPADWNLHPRSRGHFPTTHWARSLRAASTLGDVKLTWEIGRFPQAFALARVAALDAAMAQEASTSIRTSILDFLARNPLESGIHWASSQEVVFRLIAWLFAAKGLVRDDLDPEFASALARAVAEGAIHVEAFLPYARHAVYNNHVLSEALGLLLASRLLPGLERASRWRSLALEILEEETPRQFAADGSYLQNSHTYHRVALQVLLLAWLVEARDGKPPAAWTTALERSLEFLLAHQNPLDGKLPNYGANDGALPLCLSTCDYGDFRPTLQTLSVALRAELIYPPGPWDEEAAWLLGPKVLEAPLRPPSRKSISFRESGYHVLRGRDPSSFGAFRAGSVQSRFSQIDMLHLDLWRRGENVLVDGGSYLYGDPEWQPHFHRAASHNTVVVDGQDPMLHFRPFKNLYPLRGAILDFEDAPEYAMAASEHRGFERLLPGTIHRRAVLFLKDEHWVIADTILGSGPRTLRLHWLAAPLPFVLGAEDTRILLETHGGPLSLQVLDSTLQPISLDVEAGRESPPRGWQSLYYAEKVPAPSIAVQVHEAIPTTLFTLLGPGLPSLIEEGGRIRLLASGREASFRLDRGLFRDIQIEQPRYTEEAR